MASTTTLPRSEQIYNTFGRWVYVLPTPSSMPSAPTVNTAGDLGTIVVVPSTNSAYILVSSSAAGYIWEDITPGGAAGPGNFSSLVVTPGPITMDGTTLINNTAAGTAATTIGNVATGGAIQLLSAGNITETATGTMAISGAPVNINVGANTGVVTIGNTANTVSMGLNANGALSITSLGNAATSVNIAASATVGGGITLSSNSGGINLNPTVSQPVGINAGTSSAGVVTIGSGVSTAINIASVIPTVGRTVTISDGLIGTAVADALNLGNGGVNFAGSTRTINIGSGPVTIGTNTVNIADGAVGATGIKVVNIAQGAVTGGGSSTVAIGSASAGSTVTVTTPATTAAGSGLGIQSGVGAVVNILAGAGDPTGSAIGPKGSLYIKTDAAGATDRLWIATAANTWAFFTASA